MFIQVYKYVFRHPMQMGLNSFPSNENKRSGKYIGTCLKGGVRENFEVFDFSPAPDAHVLLGKGTKSK